MKNLKGFTLIESLVVGLIIIIIGGLAAWAVNSARSHQRDATRLAQVRILQSALEDFFNDNSLYPVGENFALGEAGVSSCLGSSGFAGDCAVDQKVYLRLIPAVLNKGLKGLSVCGAPERSAFCYFALQEKQIYRLQFELENDWPQVGLEKGLNCALPGGIDPGACRAP